MARPHGKDPDDDTTLYTQAGRRKFVAKLKSRLKLGPESVSSLRCSCGCYRKHSRILDGTRVGPQMCIRHKVMSRPIETAEEVRARQNRSYQKQIREMEEKIAKYSRWIPESEKGVVKCRVFLQRIKVCVESDKLKGVPKLLHRLFKRLDTLNVMNQTGRGDGRIEKWQIFTTFNGGKSTQTYLLMPFIG